MPIPDPPQARFLETKECLQIWKAWNLETSWTPHFVESRNSNLPVSPGSVHVENLFFWSNWLLRPVGYQMCQLKIWKQGYLRQECSARRPEPVFLSQEYSARISWPGILFRQSPANLFGVRAGVQTFTPVFKLHTWQRNHQVYSIAWYVNDLL